MDVTAERVGQDRTQGIKREEFIYARITKGPHTGLQPAVKLELSDDDVAGMSNGLVAVRMGWDNQCKRAYVVCPHCHEAHRWDHCQNVPVCREFFIHHNCQTGGLMRYLEPLRNQAAPAGRPCVGRSQPLLGDDAARAEQIVTEQRRASLNFRMQWAELAAAAGWSMRTAGGQGAKDTLKAAMRLARQFPHASLDSLLPGLDRRTLAADLNRRGHELYAAALAE